MPKFVKCLIVFATLHMSYGKTYEECRGINKPNTVVPSTKSCSKYIFCNGANSYEGECLAGNYFNPVEGNCDAPDNVICNIEPSDDVKSIFDQDFKPDKSEIQDNTSENIDEDGDNGDEGEDVEDGNDSGDEGDGDDGDGNNVNVDGGIEGSTEINTHMEKEDNQKNPGHNFAITIQHHQQPGKCPQVYGLQSIKNIANPKSCVSFFACYNGIAIPMLCPAKMYFNELSGKCETQMPHSCKLKHSVRLSCHKGINDFVPHPYRCEYYFYCLNGNLLIMRCPKEFTWNYELRTCVHKSYSNCYFEKSVIYHNDN